MTRALVVAVVLRRFWWRVRRPVSVGVQAIVLDEHDRVLLVRNSYDRAGSLRFPGGGAKRGESLAAAALRELREETGVTVPRGEDAAELLGLYVNVAEGKTDHVGVFVLRPGTWIGGTSDSAEISRRVMAPIAELPVEVTDASRRRLAELRGEVPLAVRW